MASIMSSSSVFGIGRSKDVIAGGLCKHCKALVLEHCHLCAMPNQADSQSRFRCCELVVDRRS